MEFLTGGIRRIDVPDAEIYGGPADSLQRQGLLPGELPARQGRFAVVVCRYSPTDRRIPFFCRSMDEAAVIMSDLRQIARNRAQVDAYRKAGIAVWDEVPEGWIRQDGTTAPEGFAWYSNGRSHFDGTRAFALVRINGGDIS